MVNEEVVYLIFQMDLDTQLQRCLNYEAYQEAKEVRSKRQRVDEAVALMKERKARNSSTPAEAARLSVSDFAAEGLRLRTELQRAVQEERYKDAAAFRDLLAELDRESKQAAAMSGEWDASSAPGLRLGQRVVHKTNNYRGVVVGWDLQCCESEDWAAANGVEQLSKGEAQPFYHVLVDARDWSYSSNAPPTAYVAEELLTCPELDEASPGKSWVEVYGKDPAEHPYLYILFLGQDARGDYLPCRQLRDKYNIKRRDVYKPGEPEEQPGEQ